MFVKRFWADGALLAHHQKSFLGVTYEMDADRCKSTPMNDDSGERAMGRVQGDFLDCEQGVSPKGFWGGFEEIGGF
jgi:hypothetical protein